MVDGARRRGVGVYERLLEDPRFAAGPTIISGTSAGGINAALIAAGKSPREMLQFWQAIADDPPVRASHVFFEDALRAFLRLGVEEGLRWLASARPARAFLQ